MNTPLKVIIGGESAFPDWKSMNADSSTSPDILSDITALSGIDENSVSVFYLSHVLEHIKLTDVLLTLSKIYAAMNKHSTLFISVPDLTVLSQLLQDNELDINQKIHVLRMIYGGQISNYDYHYFGYTYEILEAFLKTTGFTKIRKAKYFSLHKDTSSFTPYKGIPISLNIICHKS
jgi:predicted SAM-dependent methyltransferase